MAAFMACTGWLQEIEGRLVLLSDKLLGNKDG